MTDLAAYFPSPAVLPCFCGAETQGYNQDCLQKGEGASWHALNVAWRPVTLLPHFLGGWCSQIFRWISRDPHLMQ